jgi:hypothetical protein
MDDATEERIARNDATFRVANERIAETAAEQRIDRLVPFICECAEPRCTEIIQLSMEEYRSVRAEPTQFLTVPDHEGGPASAARVVAENNRFVIVRKTGRAGEVARELDTPAEDEVA